MISTICAIACVWVAAAILFLAYFRALARGNGARFPEPELP